MASTSMKWIHSIYLILIIAMQNIPEATFLFNNLYFYEKNYKELEKYFKHYKQGTSDESF